MDKGNIKMSNDIQALAKLARPQSEEDWGSDRQLEAEYNFWIQMRVELGDEADDAMTTKFESSKMEVDERIDYALNLLEKEVKQRINVEKGFCQIEDGQIYPCFYTLKRQYWNGWAVPLLEESVYEKWIESIDDGSEEIKEMREEHTPVEVYEVSTGKFLKCYGREFGYCWDEVTEQGMDLSAYRGCDYGDD